MPRSKTVTVNGKSIFVTEKRIGELEGIVTKLSAPFNQTMKADNVEAIKEGLMGALYEKIPEIIAPELTPDDMKNAYPSELEELVGAFIDVNFTGVKKLFSGPLLTLARAGLLPK